MLAAEFPCFWANPEILVKTLTGCFLLPSVRDRDKEMSMWAIIFSLFLLFSGIATTFSLFGGRVALHRSARAVFLSFRLILLSNLLRPHYFVSILSDFSRTKKHDRFLQVPSC